MWELFISLFLLNGVEGLFYVLSCTRFKVKDIRKLDLFLCWFFITVLNYTITRFITIPIPLLNQIILLIVGSVLLSIMLDSKIKNILLLFLIPMAVMLCIEVPSHSLILHYFNIDIFTLTSEWIKFLYFIPIRIVELLIISSIFLINIKELRRMKTWFGKLERKPKK